MQAVQQITQEQFTKSAWQTLKQANLKQTPIRQLLVNVFAQISRPISAYAIKDTLETVSQKTINIVTIYRNLETFQAQGLIHYVSTAEGFFRCNLQHAQTCSSPTDHDCHHSFLVCRSCSHVQEYFQEAGCNPAEKQVSQEINFICETHINEVVGLCRQCQ